MTEFVTEARARNHTLALSEEQNREICLSAAKVLFGEVPPISPY